DRILGIVFPPAHVRNFLDRLQRIIVAGREPGIDDLPRNARRLASAEIGGFDNGAQHALGRNRVFSDVPAIGRQHALSLSRGSVASIFLTQMLPETELPGWAYRIRTG